jgi:hypothetical protein
VLPEPLGELADRRGLAGAVDADDEQDARRGGDVERPGIAEQGRELVGERVAELRQVLARLEPLDELCGRRDADVCADERFLEALPGRVVTGIERGGRKLGGERAAALRERIPQPREEPGTVRLGLGLRILLAEEL